MIILMLVTVLTATSPNPAQELKQILDCGIEAQRAECCRIGYEIVRDAHLAGDVDTERIVSAYLKRNCPMLKKGK
jgi:hypothetical protein